MNQKALRLMFVSASTKKGQQQYSRLLGNRKKHRNNQHGSTRPTPVDGAGPLTRYACGVFDAGGVTALAQLLDAVPTKFDRLDARALYWLRYCEVGGWHSGYALLYPTVQWSHGSGVPGRAFRLV
jgi:hypothetical protein